MTIARHLKWYLDHESVEYDLVHHPRSDSSIEAADLADVPRDQMAKCVLLEDERGYLMAVLPASRRVAFDKLRRLTRRHLEMALEFELEERFEDCEIGAVPPIAGAYGLSAVVDTSLLGKPDIYFEAGDHEDLVHMKGAKFLNLMKGAQYGDFTRPN